MESHTPQTRERSRKRRRRAVFLTGSSAVLSAMFLLLSPSPSTLSFKIRLSSRSLKDESSIPWGEVNDGRIRIDRTDPELYEEDILYQEDGPSSPSGGTVINLPGTPRPQPPLQSQQCHDTTDEIQKESVLLQASIQQDSAFHQILAELRAGDSSIACGGNQERTLGVTTCNIQWNELYLGYPDVCESVGGVYYEAHPIPQMECSNKIQYRLEGHFGVCISPKCGKVDSERLVGRKVNRIENILEQQDLTTHSTQCSSSYSYHHGTASGGSNGDQQQHITPEEFAQQRAEEKDGSHSGAAGSFANLLRTTLLLGVTTMLIA